MFFFFIPTGTGLWQGRDGGPTGPSPCGGLIEIRSFSPKKERKRRVEGRQGDTICPEASHFSRSGRAASSLGSQSSPAERVLRGLLSASGTTPAVPAPESSVPALLCPQSGRSGRPRLPPPSPLGGAGGLWSRASDFTRNRRQNRGVRRAPGSRPSPTGEARATGAWGGPAPASVRAPARGHCARPARGAGGAGAGRAGGFGGGAQASRGAGRGRRSAWMRRHSWADAHVGAGRGGRGAGPAWRPRIVQEALGPPCALPASAPAE